MTVTTLFYDLSSYDPKAPILVYYVYDDETKKFAEITRNPGQSTEVEEEHSFNATQKFELTTENTRPPFYQMVVLSPNNFLRRKLNAAGAWEYEAGGPEKPWQSMAADATNVGQFDGLSDAAGFKAKCDALTNTAPDDASLDASDYNNDGISVLLKKFLETEPTHQINGYAVAAHSCISAKEFTHQKMFEFMVIFLREAQDKKIPKKARLAFPIQLSGGSHHFVMVGVELDQVNDDIDESLAAHIHTGSTLQELWENEDFKKKFATLYKSCKLTIVDSLDENAATKARNRAELRMVKEALLSVFHKFPHDPADATNPSFDPKIPFKQTDGISCGAIATEHAKEFLKTGKPVAVAQADVPAYLQKIRKEHLQQGGAEFRKAMREGDGVKNAERDFLQNGGALNCIARYLAKELKLPAHADLFKQVTKKERFYQASITIDKNPVKISVYGDSIRADVINERTAKLLIESYIHAMFSPRGYQQPLPPTTPILFNSKPLTIAISGETPEARKILTDMAAKYQLSVVPEKQIITPAPRYNPSDVNEDKPFDDDPGPGPDLTIR